MIEDIFERLCSPIWIPDDDWTPALYNVKFKTVLQSVDQRYPCIPQLLLGPRAKWTLNSDLAKEIKRETEAVYATLPGGGPRSAPDSVDDSDDEYDGLNTVIPRCEVHMFIKYGDIPVQSLQEKVTFSSAPK